MSKEIKSSLSAILDGVQTSRRGFLKHTLLASSLLAIAAPASTVLAAEATPAGKGDAKGKGDGKGKGKGQ